MSRATTCAFYSSIPFYPSVRKTGSKAPASFTLRNVHVDAVQKVERVIVIGPREQIRVPLLLRWTGVLVRTQLRGIRHAQTVEARIFHHVAIRVFVPGAARYDRRVHHDGLDGGRQAILLLQFPRHRTLQTRLYIIADHHLRGE